MLQIPGRIENPGDLFGPDTVGNRMGRSQQSTSIAPALNSVVRGPSRLYEGSRSLIQGAIDELVKRAKKSGNLRREVDASDLLRALIGVCHVGSGPDWLQSARRLVDILIAGSRPV